LDVVERQLNAVPLKSDVLPLKRRRDEVAALGGHESGVRRHACTPRYPAALCIGSRGVANNYKNRWEGK
jgi:hypothetical protein